MGTLNGESASNKKAGGSPFGDQSLFSTLSTPQGPQESKGKPKYKLISTQKKTDVALQCKTPTAKKGKLFLPDMIIFFFLLGC